jgi:hypothetical protein
MNPGLRAAHEGHNLLVQLACPGHGFAAGRCCFDRSRRRRPEPRRSGRCVSSRASGEDPHGARTSRGGGGPLCSQPLHAAPCRSNCGLAVRCGHVPEVRRIPPLTLPLLANRLSYALGHCS